MSRKKYLNIVRHYESCLKKHGDTHLGVNWPRAKEIDLRHQVMLEVIKEKKDKKIKLLDFGCGTSALYEYIKKKKLNNIIYSGLDLSEEFIKIAKNKFPKNKYYCLDILTDYKKLPIFNYIVLSGVFTQKRDLTQKEMFAFFKKMINRVFSKAKNGIAFNLLPKQVDYEKKESFYLSFDKLANFLVKEVSRNFIIRNDYGLWEYTTYVYK